jgi:hypothetical protein
MFWLLRLWTSGYEHFPVTFKLSPNWPTLLTVSNIQIKIVLWEGLHPPRFVIFPLKFPLLRFTTKPFFCSLVPISSSSQLNCRTMSLISLIFVTRRNPATRHFRRRDVLDSRGQRSSRISRQTSRKQNINFHYELPTPKKKSVFLKLAHSAE